MNRNSAALPDILRTSPVRVVFGAGCLAQLGALASAEGAARVLLVTDPGIVAAGHAARARDALQAAGLSVVTFDGAAENPTTRHVAAGLQVARAHNIDFIVGLGGGSALDCAKGVNLLFTNGGEIVDYWGIDKAQRPMLPLIAVPTTAGTGSEAQSFALISDPVTHQKMACGDRRLPMEGGLRPRVALLDPELTLTQPAAVAAAAGIDAIAHAVETAATTRRNAASRAFSRAAWRELLNAYETAVHNPRDAAARAAMLLGAHLAGCAIEQSMLGAAHACANPLTAKFDITHGVAVGLLLPHVVAFNTSAANRATPAADDLDAGENPYADLEPSPARLIETVERLLDAGRIPRRLSALGIPEAALPELAELAAKQWTAGFNPRPVGPAELLDIYRRAWA